MAYSRPLDYEALSERVLALLAVGMSLSMVARDLGISKSSVPRIRDWALGRLLPRKRGEHAPCRRNVTVLSDMTECRAIRNRQTRASRALIEDLRREHPEREI